MSEKEIKKLTDLPGVGEGTVEKFEENNIHNVKAVAAASPGKISSLLHAGGIEKAEEIITKAQKSIGDFFMTAQELHKINIRNITTGSDNLDKVLGGGIETGRSTSFYSKFGTGKTQTAMQLAVNVQLPEDKFLFKTEIDNEVITNLNNNKISEEMVEKINDCDIYTFTDDIDNIKVEVKKEGEEWLLKSEGKQVRID
ncbi:MAG: hypothetical protein ACOCRX_04660, partial [Candidatus Woesearchaeota archaeon]